MTKSPRKEEDAIVSYKCGHRKIIRRAYINRNETIKSMRNQDCPKCQKELITAIKNLKKGKEPVTE